ncbi:TPA: DUF3265 domain-containing protein [Vibrio campbellii]|nr:DUF3265 domain-containing protein [Vibrio campbellii]
MVSENNTHNKLFKRDSQRVAFLLCVDFSDLGGLQRLRYCVAHPLAGRYVLGGNCQYEHRAKKN